MRAPPRASAPRSGLAAPQVPHPEVVRKEQGPLRSLKPPANQETAFRPGPFRTRSKINPKKARTFADHFHPLAHNGFRVLFKQFARASLPRASAPPQVASALFSRVCK